MWSRCEALPARPGLGALLDPHEFTDRQSGLHRDARRALPAVDSHARDFEFLSQGFLREAELEPEIPVLPAGQAEAG